MSNPAAGATGTGGEPVDGPSAAVSAETAEAVEAVASAANNDAGSADAEEAGRLQEGDAPPAPHQTTSPDQPMSKSRQKKLAKLERIAEYKAQRRDSERAAKKQRQEQRRQELTQTMQSMTEQERDELLKKHQENRKDRQSEHSQRRTRLEQSLTQGPDLVIDLGFEGMMNEGELKHLCQQLSYSYSVNAKVAQPCHLHLVGWKGDVKAMTEKQLSGLPNWFVTKTERSYVEHFAERKDKLVYLTADSGTEITQLDPGSIYIIGGIVDHNRFKGLCLNRAEKDGIATARLPIKQYIQLDSRAVLTVNHVVQIMVEMYNRHDWQAVLDEVIPPRKRAGFKALKAQQAQQAAQQQGGQSSEGPEDGNQEPLMEGEEETLAEGSTAPEGGEPPSSSPHEEAQPQGLLEAM